MLSLAKPSKAQKFIEGLAVSKICEHIRAGEFDAAEKFLLEKDYSTDKIALEVMASGDPIAYTWYASTRLEVARWTEIAEAVVAGNVNYLRAILAPSGASDWSVALCAAVLLGRREIIDLVLELGPTPYLPRNVSATHVLVGEGGFLDDSPEYASRIAGSRMWPVDFSGDYPRCYSVGIVARKVLKYLQKHHSAAIPPKK